MTLFFAFFKNALFSEPLNPPVLAIIRIVDALIKKNQKKCVFGKTVFPGAIPEIAWLSLAIILIYVKKVYFSCSTIKFTAELSWT